ncbi:putative gamma-glutamylcyclotransferase At3g02910 [Curcuma longa]|uniref:putative gamma-glutamylcyclotransferase At3g02910 n=1 Tax=Curcuma longa TaxID=136217 RepID=UPI003D9F02E5
MEVQVVLASGTSVIGGITAEKYMDMTQLVDIFIDFLIVVVGVGVVGMIIFVGPKVFSPFSKDIGPLSIPFLLRLLGSGRRVDGELYAVSSRGLSRLDELEGTTRGHYERLPLVVVPWTLGVDDDEARDAEEGADAPGAVTAEAYFAHPSFGEDLWRRCRERGLASYTEDDASGYVPPKDGPAGTTFLGEVLLKQCLSRGTYLLFGNRTSRRLTSIHQELSRL